MFDDDDGRTYLVVINQEEQYSIWPESRTVPGGWEPVGTRGSKAECLDYIDRVWTDLRPRSARREPLEPPAA